MTVKSAEKPKARRSPIRFMCVECGQFYRSTPPAQCCRCGTFVPMADVSYDDPVLPKGETPITSENPK